MFKRKRLRLLAYWRRWRAQEGPQPLRGLLQRAEPAAPWLKRVNWLLGVADWLHYEPAGMRSGERVRQLIKSRRLRLLLNEIDNHPALYAAAVETLRSIMKDADGLELFCATGLPREPALVSEVVEQLVAKLLPKTLIDRDLDSLFGALFPAPGHAAWIEHMEPATLARMHSLVLTGEVPARFRRNAEDALIYLARVVSAIGMHPDVRARLPFTSLRVTPFLKLEDAVRALVMVPPPEAEGQAASLAEARAALFQTRAAVLEAYRHLSHHGVSVFLVYRLQRMRALTERMDALLTLLFPRAHETEHGARFLADLIRARHQRTSVRALLRRNTSLLARKMVEHNAEHGDHYIARNRDEYNAMFKAALGGGVLTALTTWLKFVIIGFGLAKFIEGLVASINYAASFIAIQLAGFVLATKQPAMTGPALATSLENIHHQGGLRALIDEVVQLMRSQSAAVLGNVLAVAPTVLLFSALLVWLHGKPMLSMEKAGYTLHSFSLLGPTPFYAAFTGVLLWASSLFAGYADNWFVLRGIESGIAFNRRIQAVFGEQGAQRIAAFLERNFGGFAANISLGLLLGLVPAFAVFAGLPLDVRHVTLSTGSAAGAVYTLGPEVMLHAGFWLALAGIASMAVLNVSVAFVLAFALALNASNVSARTRARVFRGLRWRALRSPLAFFLPTQFGRRARALARVDPPGIA